MKPRSLVGLARVSTDEQAGERRAGLDRQVESIKRIARSCNVPEDRLTIVQVIGVSGSDVGQTPEWTKQVLPLLSGPDTHLAVDAIDRLIRPDRFNFDVLAQLQARGTRVITPTGEIDLRTPAGFLQAVMGSAVGGMEKMEIGRRSAAAREEKRRRGEWCAGLNILPTGITYNPKTATWGYDDKAADVRRVFEGVVRDGLTFAQVGREIGVTSQGVRGILENRLYRGVWRIDEKRGFETYMKKSAKKPSRKKIARTPEEIIEVRVFGDLERGQQPQLIEDSLWYSAQEIIARNKVRHKRARNRSHDHVWASGFLYSALGDVGSFGFGFDTGPVRIREHIIYGVTRRLGTAKQASFWYRCQCQGGAGIEHRCGIPHLPAPEINQALDNLFSSICRTKKFQRDVIDRAAKAAGGPEVSAGRTRIEEKIAAEGKRKDRILAGYEAGLYGVEEAKKKMMDLQTAVDALQGQLDRLGTRDPEAEREAVRAHFANLETWNPGWSRDEKQAWMRRYVRGVIVGPDGVGGIILRLPRADGSIEEREHLTDFSWSMLGFDYDPMNREARQEAARREEGVFKTADLMQALGVSSNRIGYLVRSGKIAAPTGKEGLHRVWSREAFERAVEQGRAL